MIHDSWHNTGDEAFRLTTYAKVSHVQARELALHFGESKPIGPSDIWVLYIKVLRAAGHLSALIEAYNAAEAQPSPGLGARYTRIDCRALGRRGLALAPPNRSRKRVV